MSPSWTLKELIRLPVWKQKGIYSQAKEHRASIRTRTQKNCCRVQPKPSHHAGIRISKTCAIVMEHITSICEALPFFISENTTPRTRSSNSYLKPAHFLHAIYFSGGEHPEISILFFLNQSFCNWRDICFLE